MQHEGSMGRRVAVVVGGGPTGALTAVYLAKQGWKVHVLEKRGALPRRPPRDDDRAYCLVLNPRGIAALLAAGVDLTALTTAANGRLTVSQAGLNGKNARSMESVVEPLNPERLMMYRDELSSHLLSEMHRLQPTINLHLGAEVTRIDLDKQQVAFSQAGKAAKVLSYHLLVGADGAGSVVRQAMAQVLPPGFCQQRVADARSAIAALPPMEPDGISHSTYEKYDFKAGNLLWSDRGDGDRRVVVNLTAKWAARIREDPAALDQTIDDGQHLPQLPDFARQGIKALLHSRPKLWEVFRWVVCSQLVGPKVVLLGDAAHSMSPNLGQGCNSSLEDVRILAGILEGCGGNVDAALQRYNAERLPDVQALLNVNMMWSATAGMRVEGLSFPAAAWMACHRTLIMGTMIARFIPYKLAPSVFPQPMFMQCMLGKRPYRHIFTEAYAMLAVLAGLCLIPILRVFASL